MQVVNEKSTEGIEPRPANSLVWVVAALAALLASALLVIVYLITTRPSGAQIEIIPPPPTPSAEPLATLAPLSIYITGAVNQPGLVELPAGSRVSEAVEAADGFSADASRENINLAAPLVDGQHVRVPAIGEDPPPAQAATADGPININSATVEELTTLPGIGPALAARIVAYREENGLFRTLEDLMQVAGIGEVKLEGCRTLITVGP